MTKIVLIKGQTLLLDNIITWITTKYKQKDAPTASFLCAIIYIFIVKAIFS